MADVESVPSERLTQSAYSIRCTRLMPESDILGMPWLQQVVIVAHTLVGRLLAACGWFFRNARRANSRPMVGVGQEVSWDSQFRGDRACLVDRWRRGHGCSPP
jgi:hypothetical protein